MKVQQQTPSIATLYTRDPSSLVLTVTELNNTVASILECTFPLLWISGEVSNFTRAASGHWYFTLKDDTAQVRAIMFRGRAQTADFTPKEGDRVEVRATVSLYTARGDFQLNVEAIRHAGTGNLYEAFLRLKAKLEQEGLFDIRKKVPLPGFVRTIGLVTSPKAAALRDVLTTLARRAPHVNLILYPAAVQGEEAAPKIAQAITAASTRAECDVLLICRGGGSIEDLWSFNEEIVARAISACTIPTITGVGHETDFTIADFVADLRAPTPTGAAELVTRSRQDWHDTLQAVMEKMQYTMKRLVQSHMQSTDLLARRLVSPAAYIERERIRLHSRAFGLTQARNNLDTQLKHELSQLNIRLRTHLPDTRAWRFALAHCRKQLNSGITLQLTQERQTTLSLAAQIELLSPERTLKRGYAILADARGHIIRSPAQLSVRKPVSVQLAEGHARINIESVQPELE